MSDKVLYHDTALVRDQWRVVTILSEINGDEYHTETVVLTAEPIVSITISTVPDAETTVGGSDES